MINARALMAYALVLLASGCASVPAKTYVAAGQTHSNQGRETLACPAGSAKRVTAQTYGQLRDSVGAVSESTLRVGNYIPAKLVAAPVMQYPKTLLGGFGPGFVSVFFGITSQGDVVAPKVVCSTGSQFEKPALEAVASAHYRPASLNGVPIQDVGIQPFIFDPRP